MWTLNICPNFIFTLILSLILNLDYMCYFRLIHFLIFSFHYFVNYFFIFLFLFLLINFICYYYIIFLFYLFILFFLSPLSSFFSSTYSHPRMKISVITDISVLRFYGYIGYIGDIFGYIGDISADILEKNIGA